jgi:hypothetical protein
MADFRSSIVMGSDSGGTHLLKPVFVGINTLKWIVTSEPLCIM